MTGTWRFKLEHGISPAVRGELPADAAVARFRHARRRPTEPTGRTSPSPANWEVEGFSIPTYQERAGNQSDDIGLYRRWVEVPASFAGQRVLWHFDGVYDGAEVFVNGQRAATTKAASRPLTLTSPKPSSPASAISWPSGLQENLLRQPG